MSLLKLSCPTVGDLSLKVLTFSSPLSGNMASSQTKLAKHHFPIKADQQNVQFTAIFNGWAEYEALQTYVRDHQIRSLTTVENPEVVMNWPERNIINWSGVILNLKAGDDRFNYAPKAQINFLLIDSMLSQKTWTSSFGEDFRKWFDTDIGDPVDPIINLPNPGNMPGGTKPGGGFGGVETGGQVPGTRPTGGGGDF